MSCHVAGFFALAHGNRLRVNKPYRPAGATASTGQAGTWYAQYDTTLTCIKDVFVAAQIRVYSPPHDVIHPDDSVAFVVGKLCLQPGVHRALIDATHMHIKPGDVASEDYEDTIPAFPHSYIFSVGSVSGKHEVLEDRSRVFPVTLSEYVREEVKQFQIMCLFNGDTARWAHTNIPSVGSTIHFSGTCSRLLPSGLLAVELDSIVFNLGPQPAPVIQPSNESSRPAKKRKFHPYPPSFEQSVPAVLASPSTSAPPVEGSSTSAQSSADNSADQEMQDGSTSSNAMSAKLRGKQKAK